MLSEPPPPTCCLLPMDCLEACAHLRAGQLVGRRGAGALKLCPEVVTARALTSGSVSLHYPANVWLV